jgi:hypothetical protein
MEENMTEDFIIEEESESPSNRRPFLIAVGALLAIFVLSVICSASILLARNGGGDANTEQIAARETENAIVAVTNEAVTATIAAMETEAARPTDTPAAPPTNTPAPTNTPLPTNTPVVRQAEEAASQTEEAATAAAEGTDEGTAVADAGVSTPTPIAALGGTNGGDDSLPETGIETWGIFMAALALVIILFSARRLRGG